MYKRITVPVDNSEYSGYAVDAGIELADKFGSYICGSHVYASRLHDSAFRRMEEGLPDQYQEEEELQRQRRIHDSLIDRGLRLISESILDDFSEKAEQRGLSAGRKVIEGKNFATLLKDIEDSAYDLVVIGAQGLGQVKRSVIGSVCERVCRDSNADVLVTKKPPVFSGARILCGIDGSANSYSALKRALAIAREFGAEVDAAHVFDSSFHTVAFKSISEVLSDEAAKVFKFEEQQKLHDEIIDRGLKKVGERHLERAKLVAKENGAEINTIILDGKPYDRIIDLVEEGNYDLVVTGRFGSHYVRESRIGSHAYNILLTAPCNHLIVSEIDESLGSISLSKPGEEHKPVVWSAEAEQRLGNVPSFVRSMVKKRIEEYARGEEREIVDSSVMDEARKRMGF